MKAFIGLAIILVWGGLSWLMIKSADSVADHQSISWVKYIIYGLLAMIWFQPVTSRFLSQNARGVYVIVFVALCVGTAIFVSVFDFRAALLLVPVIPVAVFGAWFILSQSN